MLALLPLLLLQPAPKDADRFAKWEPQIAAIEKRLKESMPEPGGVFFAGSSSIRLWDLKKSFPEKSYVNVGFGGSQIRDCTHFVPRLITPHRPATIVLYAGDNDVAAGRTAEQVLADFKAYCRDVHADLPKCRILFIPIKPSLARWKQIDEQKKANELVQDYCGTDPRLGYVDIVPLMLGSDGKPDPKLFAKDGLHMGAAGYEKWTTAVAAALRKPR